MLYAKLSAKLYQMSANPNPRRVRRPDSLAASVVELLDDYRIPMPTHAVRIILTDRGRPVTAEHLGRLAAYERADFLRTLEPPRLCGAIDTDAYAVTPRWWARGDWRLRRRILSEDVKQIWQARLGDLLCTELAERRQPPGPEIVTFALGTIARLLPNRYFDVPCSAGDWMHFHSLLSDKHPSVTGPLESPTRQQSHAEQQLRAAGFPAVDLYFGRQR